MPAPKSPDGAPLLFSWIPLRTPFHSFQPSSPESQGSASDQGSMLQRTFLVCTSESPHSRLAIKPRVRWIRDTRPPLINQRIFALRICCIVFVVLCAGKKAKAIRLSSCKMLSAFFAFVGWRCPLLYIFVAH